MKRVLVISYSFPPLNNIAARRFGQMLQYFENNGWEPWVLTAASEGPLPLPVPERRVVTIGRHGQKSAAVGVDLPPRLRRVKDMTERVRLTSVSRSIFTWYRAVTSGWAQVEGRLPEFDCILASSGPSSALWVGRWLADRTATPWVADFRDLAALRPYGRLAPAVAIDRMIERRLVGTASGFVSVSEAWTEILTEAYGRPGAVVYNGWAGADRIGHGRDAPTNEPDPAARVAMTPPTDRYVYYAGRFYADRVPAVGYLLEALRDRPAVSFVIRGLGPPHLEREVLERAQRLGVADRVRLLAPCDPDTVRAEAAGALCQAVFEVVESGEAWPKGALTGKLLQLVAMPRPVLAIARADSEIGGILAETRKGELCPDPTTTGSFLDRVLEGEIPAPDEQAIRRYSKQNQAARLTRFLDRVVERHAA